MSIAATPPQVHVIGPDTAATVDLRDLRVMEGACGRKDLREALAYGS